MKTERYPADEIMGFLSILLASGTPQLSVCFDWRTGEYEVSWPERTAELEEEDED